MKKKLWLLSIIILLVTFGLLFSYFYSVEKTRKIAEIVGHQKIHAKQAVKSFQVLFNKWNSVLFYLSNDENVILLTQRGEHDLGRIADYFKGEVIGITRTDSLGKIIFTIPDPANSIGVDISKQKHMAKILADHKPVVSEVFNAVQGYKAIVIHYPVFKNKVFNGTIALLLNFEQIAKDILDDIKIGNSGYAWMISSEGVELYCPIPGHVGKSIYEISEGYPELSGLAKQMLLGNEGGAEYIYYDKDRTKGEIKKIAYFIPIRIEDTFWSLAITYSENDITKSLTSFRNRLIVIFILLFAGSIVLFFYGVKIWGIVNESKLRKTVEEALIKERTLLRALIDNLPSAVFIKDSNYRNIIANTIHITSIKGHLQYLGLNNAIDIIDKTDFEVFPEHLAKQFLEVDQKVIRDGISILNQEETGVGPDRSQIWLLVSKVPIRDAGNKIIGMVGITTNITNLKRVERELRQAKEKAEESDQLKTSFLNNISHEIRTPLNAIIGFTELLNEPDLTDDKLANYTKIIIESSNQLLLIITDIINIATIEAGQVKLNKGHVNVNAVLSILYNQFKGKADAANISFYYHASCSDENAVIVSDYIKMVEILSNLINNALKFTSEGYVTYGYTLKNDAFEFYVKDTGLGIKHEYCDKIFNRFYQADDKIHTHKGTGLGLSISKAYVEVLGGKIWVNSSPGVGTEFYFTVPNVSV